MPTGVQVPPSLPSALPQHDHAALGYHASAIEVQDGTRAIEVAAMFEETVVDLRHFSNPKRGVVTGLTKGLLGGAGLALLTAFALFLVSYAEVGRLGAQKEAWERSNTPMSERVVPPEGRALDILSALLLAFGIGGVLVGLARLLEEREPRDFTIGPDREALFNAPGELLPVGAFPLVRSTGTDYELLFTHGMQGDVAVAGASVSLAQLAQSGQARPAGDLAGAWAWSIPNHARIKLDLGHNTFLVSSVPAPRRHAAPIAVAWNEQAYTGGVALLTAVFLLMIFSVPPDPKSLSLDSFMSENRFAKFLLTPPQEQEAKIPDWLKKNIEDDAGGKGQRSKDAEGKMGKPSSTSKNGRMTMKGPPHNTDIHLAKELAEQAAKKAGILGMLTPQEGGHVASIFGQTSALGDEAANVLGNLDGSQVGEASGANGLSVLGTHRGGGGDADGTIGLDRLASLGRGGGGGMGTSYGRGRGLFHGHSAGVPDVTPGDAHVRGDGLDKDIIRRVIRRHLNEVKFCYEQQLTKKPELFGRVLIQFTIGGTGNVLAAGVQSSSMNDPTVDQCVAGAVRRWDFPKPQGGGIVIVAYPFVFKAAGGQ